MDTHGIKFSAVIKVAMGKKIYWFNKTVYNMILGFKETKYYQWESDSDMNRDSKWKRNSDAFWAVLWRKKFNFNYFVIFVVFHVLWIMLYGFVTKQLLNLK